MVKRLKKFKRRKVIKYIQDKALIGFIHQHLQKEAIDFSKARISSFLDSLDNKEDVFKGIKTETNNEKSFSQKNEKLPTFGLSLLKDFSNVKNLQQTFKFKSFIFQ